MNNNTLIELLKKHDLYYTVISEFYYVIFAVTKLKHMTKFQLMRNIIEYLSIYNKLLLTE